MKLDPEKSLSYFKEYLPEFLSINEATKEETEKSIDEMIKAIKAERSTSFHTIVLTKGLELIKHIVTQSIEYLSDNGHQLVGKYQEVKSPKIKSIEDMTKYIDTFAKFEDLLFALSEGYKPRDHTLHSLWVWQCYQS